MTKIKAMISILNDIEIPMNGDNKDERTEAINAAVSALELISHLKDRPCEACEYHKENGCCKWDCVFDSMIYDKQ